MSRIYLDHNATAPLGDEARAAMEPWLRAERGNASSLHALGREAADAVEEARAEIAALIGAGNPDEIVFTAGATESDVWALRGVFEPDEQPARDGLIVSAVEHAAVLDTARALGRRGTRVGHIAVDGIGRLDALPLDDRTRLVAVMAANNETGNIHDVAAIARAAHAAGALVHCDAVQAAGRVPVDVRAWDVDLCAVSSHKIGGPFGAGALWIRPGTPIAPLLTGGGHERGRRSGTLNVPAIVGFAAAARAARLDLAGRAARMRVARDRFEDRVIAAVPGVRVVGDPTSRLPNTSLLAIDGVRAEALVIELDDAGVAISTGAACSSTKNQPSHVLVAMGLDRDVINGTVRVSTGAATPLDEIDRAARLLVHAVERLRALA